MSIIRNSIICNFPEEKKVTHIFITKPLDVTLPIFSHVYTTCKISIPPKKLLNNHDSDYKWSNMAQSLHKHNLFVSLKKKI